MGFTKDQLQQFRDATVPDLIGAACKLLFVGINPGLWTAATSTHFCHPSNRFYPALKKAGVIDWDIDTDTGMTDGQRVSFVAAGLGITNIVARATVRASELSTNELRQGAGRLADKVQSVGPKVVAIAGVTAYRTAFGVPHAANGRQDRELGGAELWVVPNPSGLNAHETIDSLADWYGQCARAAGISR